MALNFDQIQRLMSRATAGVTLMGVIILGHYSQLGAYPAAEDHLG
jgi:hypothetical protein